MPGQNNHDRSPENRAHILDDGFQHRQLHRDIDILLLNRDDWHDTLLPAGNLREPLSVARRATVIAIPADDPDFAAELKSLGWTGPIWRLRRRMVIPQTAGPVAAFCGIARPDQFFAGLKSAGLTVASQMHSPTTIATQLATSNACFRPRAIPVPPRCSLPKRIKSGSASSTTHFPRSHLCCAHSFMSRSRMKSMLFSGSSPVSVVAQFEVA